jgi:hypothetical protein
MDVVVSETRQILRLGKKQDFGRIILGSFQNPVGYFFKLISTKHSFPLRIRFQVSACVFPLPDPPAAENLTP